MSCVFISCQFINSHRSLICTNVAFSDFMLHALLIHTYMYVCRRKSNIRLMLLYSTVNKSST